MNATLDFLPDRWATRIARMTALKAAAASLSLWILITPGQAPAAPKNTGDNEVRQVGTLTHRALKESSGLAASRKYPGVFWTHNDSGNKPMLYGINRQGETLTTVLIANAVIADWEDLAVDDSGNLYLGDIGNNEGKRDSLAVFRCEEPDPKRKGGVAEVRTAWKLRFPSKPFDCESLFIWKGWGYVISKVFNDKNAEVYRFPLTAQDSTAVLEFVSRLKIESPVTGATISANGRLLGVVAHAGAYVFRIDGDVARAGGTKPYQVKFKNQNIESCCFAADGMLATSEDRGIFLFSSKPFLSGD